MSLPIVDTFQPPYEACKTRPATREEMISTGRFDEIPISMIAHVSSATTAATYMARVARDNGLGNHIRDALDQSAEYKAWQRAMPSKTPKAISRYQSDYKNCDLSAVSTAIDTYGVPLSVGQRLFHGGLWRGGCRQVTTRPLSTSLCPQVALRNAEWMGKAYDSGRIDLFVLRIASPTNKVFVFKQRGTSLGHESEVLIAPGACLTLTSENLVRSNYPVAKYNVLNKKLPICVLEIDIS